MCAETSDQFQTTQFPWILELGSPMRIVGSDPRATIVADGLGPPSNSQALADAQLMAAAPDLLDACRAAVSTMNYKGLAEQIQRAIDKAEGKV